MNGPIQKCLILFIQHIQDIQNFYIINFSLTLTPSKITEHGTKLPNFMLISSWYVQLISLRILMLFSSYTL